MKSTPKVKGLSKKEGAKRKMNMSGYILFSSEMRAVIKARHPDFSFGELSRLVGTEWRNLEGTKKAEYEGEEEHWVGMKILRSELKLRQNFIFLPERAAKIVEQQDRDRPPQKQGSPRAGTPVGALMGVVPSPSTMGMINQTMSPVSGNPSQRQHECLTTRQQGNEAGLLKNRNPLTYLPQDYILKSTFFFFAAVSHYFMFIVFITTRFIFAWHCLHDWLLTMNIFF